MGFRQLLSVNPPLQPFEKGEVLNALDNSKTYKKTIMSSSKTEMSQGSGLPPTQFSPDPNSGNPSWKTIALIVLPTLLLAGGIATLESPRIPFLCGILNNCAADKPFNESYNSAVKQAADSRVLGQNAQTAQELQTARDRLKNAIDQLSSIPPTAKVHLDTQKLLPSYQSELTAMEAHLTREQQAEKLLEEAEAIATNAQKETELSKQTTAWTEAADKLKAIAAGSFVADKVRDRLAECDRKIKDIAIPVDLFRPPSGTSEPVTEPEPSPSLPNAPTPKLEPLF